MKKDTHRNLWKRWKREREKRGHIDGLWCCLVAALLNIRIDSRLPAHMMTIRACLFFVYIWFITGIFPQFWSLSPPRASNVSTGDWFDDWFDDVTIAVMWLLHLLKGKLNNKLSTRGGHVIHQHVIMSYLPRRVSSSFYGLTDASLE